MTPDHQLRIPDAAARDRKAYEVLRVWISDGGSQHVSLRTEVWEDPAAWGLMLADLARHITNTYEPATAADREKILARIRIGLNVELDSKTDTPTGQ